MKNRGSFLALLIAAVVISGCVTVRSIPYDTTARQPKPNDFPIPILESNSTNRPYIVIGVVQANAGKLHDPRDTLEQLRQAAREMGGDALMDLQQGSSGSTVVEPMGNGFVAANPREIWSAKVIVWNETPKKDKTR